MIPAPIAFARQAKGLLNMQTDRMLSLTGLLVSLAFITFIVFA